MLRRQWLQFSLRSCLLLTTALCLWLGWHTRQIARQRQAVAAIEAMGGSVGSSDWRKPDRDVVFWVAFDQAKRSKRSALTDDGLRHVADIRHLKLLIINGVPITDAGLRRLACLKDLAMLDLQDTRVTAAGLAELRKALPDCDIEVYPPIDEGVPRSDER